MHNILSNLIFSLRRLLNFCCFAVPLLVVQLQTRHLGVGQIPPIRSLSPNTLFIVPFSQINLWFLSNAFSTGHKHKKGYIRTLVRKGIKLPYIAMISSFTPIPQSWFSQFTTIQHRLQDITLYLNIRQSIF